MIKKYWFIVTFVLILFVPMFCGNYNANISKDENRTLAKLEPLFTNCDGKSSFTENWNIIFEKWFEDRVGFRSKSIKIISEFRYYVFHDLMKEEWITGKENQWFYEDENRVLLHEYQNIELPTEENMKKMCEVLSKLDTQLSERGCEFIVMMAPFKDNVYPEYMLDSIHRIGLMSRAEIIYQYVVENTSLDWIYMTGLLQNNKEDPYPVFNAKYDVSHWSQYGAYLGYKELMKHIQVNDPEVYIIDEENIFFTKEKIRETFYGSFTYDDIIPVWHYKQQGELSLSHEKPDELSMDTSLFWHYTNKNTDVEGKKILICGDSMIYLFILPLIAESYEETYLVHTHTQYLNKWIDFIKPECVVKEGAERVGISYNDSYNLDIES